MAIDFQQRNFFKEKEDKKVYWIECKYCSTILSTRSMKASIIYNPQKTFFSTNKQTKFVIVMNKDYYAEDCDCLIRECVCFYCGNNIGYHVSQPCLKCLKSNHNGHFWIFFNQEIKPKETLFIETEETVYWNNAQLQIEEKETVLY